MKTLIILFVLSSCGIAKKFSKNREVYQITMFNQIDNKSNMKEDSIQIFLSIYTNDKKYYNSYFEIQSPSFNATYRVNYKEMSDSTFVFNCFQSLDEGRSLSYYFKNTKVESFLYLLMTKPVTRIDEKTFRYSIIDYDDVTKECSFVMIKNERK